MKGITNKVSYEQPLVKSTVENKFTFIAKLIYL